MGSFQRQEKTPSNRKKRPDADGAKGVSGIVKGVVVLGAIGIAVPLFLVLLVHTPWVQERVIRALADRIREDTGVRVGMSGFRWHPFRSLRLDELSAEADGRPLLRAASLRVEYTLTWARPHLQLRDVVLTRPDLRLEKDSDGSWRLPVSAGKGLESESRGASPWVRLPPMSVTVVSGRMQGFDGDRCVLDVAEMNGRLSLQGRADHGRSALEVFLETWRMELRVPSYGTVNLSAQASYGGGSLHLDRFAATVNETSQVSASGTWYDFPGGPLSIRLQAAPWRFSLKRPGRPEGSPAEAESLEGTIQVEGSVHDLRGRFDLHGSRGKLSGNAVWTSADDSSRLIAEFSLGRVLLPWGPKGPTTVSGTARLTVEAKKNAEPKGSLSAGLSEWVSGSLTMRDVVVEATYDAGVLTVRRAAARLGESGLLETSGTAVLKSKQSSPHDAAPTLDLRVEVDRLPLAVFQDFLPERPAAGFLTGRGLLQGSWPSLTWTGRLTATEVSVPPFRAKKVTVDGISSLSGLNGTRKLTVELISFAYDDRSGDSLSLNFRQDPSGTVIPFEGEGRRLFGLDRLSVKGSVASLFDFPKVVRLDKADIALQGENLQLQGEARYHKDALELQAFRVMHGSEQAVIQGTVGVSGPMDLSVQLAAVDLGRWLAPSSLGGRLDGRLRLQGSLENPVVAFEAAVPDFKVPGFSRTTVAVSGRYEKGLVTGRGELSGPSWENPVMLEGVWPLRVQLVPLRINLSEGGEGQLRTAARDVPLEPFQALIPLENLKGRASWDVRLVGSVTTFRLEGGGTVTQAAFQWPKWGERLENMDIRWRAEGQSLFIEDAVFRLLGSRARAWGEVRLPRGRFDGYTVHVSGENVRFPEIFGIEGEGAARGIISQAGEAFAPDILGEITLTKASINLGELEKDVARQIRVVEETGRGPVVVLGARRGQPEKPEGFQSVAMKLEIRLPPRGAWARGFGLEAEVQGSTVLQKTRGGPIQLLGTLSTSKGEYVFQGVRLKVVEGELTFRGHTPPDPFLSLTCRKDVRDVSVTASLTGQLSRPVLVFSSSPEMDQVDIVSVLLYGRPAKELSTSQSRDLQDRGVQFVWAGTTPVVKSLLGKTPLSPDAVDIKGTENGSVVEVGKYLTPDLYVTYQKGLEGDDKDELRAEYRVNRYLSVESQVGRDDRAGVDVFFRYDFGD